MAKLELKGMRVYGGNDRSHVISLAQAKLSSFDDYCFVSGDNGDTMGKLTQAKLMIQATMLLRPKEMVCELN